MSSWGKRYEMEWSKMKKSISFELLSTFGVCDQHTGPQMQGGCLRACNK
jgi:hypothetical protein